MKMGYNKLAFYFLLDLIPISVAFVLLPVLFGIVLYCSNRKKWLKDLLVSVMEKYFKQVGRKKSKTAKETRNKLTSEIDISKVSFEDSTIYGIFLFASCFSLVYVFAQVCDAFIVRVQQDNCVDGLDCYLFNGQINILKEPLNCTDYTGDFVDSNQFAIFCYKLAWDLNRLFDDLGGALASIGIEFLLIAGLSQRVSRCLYGEKDEEDEQNLEQNLEQNGEEEGQNGGKHRQNVGREILEAKSENERKNAEDGSEPGGKKITRDRKILYHIIMLALAIVTAFVANFVPVIGIRPGWDVYLLSDVTKPFQHVTITFHILLAFSIPWPTAK